MVLSSSSVEQYVARRTTSSGPSSARASSPRSASRSCSCVSRVPVWAWQRWAWHLLGRVDGPAAAGVHAPRRRGRRKPQLDRHRLVQRPAVGVPQARPRHLDRHDPGRRRSTCSATGSSSPSRSSRSSVIAVGPRASRGGDLGTTLILLLLVGVGRVLRRGASCASSSFRSSLLAVAIPLITATAELAQPTASRPGSSGCGSERGVPVDLLADTCTASGRWRRAASSASASATRRRSGRGCPRPTTTSSSRSSARSSVSSARASCSASSSCSPSRSSRSCAAPTTASSGSSPAAIMTWIIGQALVNIAVVLGLLPVLGVPLPLDLAGWLVAHLRARRRSAWCSRSCTAARATRRPSASPRDG